MSCYFIHEAAPTCSVVQEKKKKVEMNPVSSSSTGEGCLKHSKGKQREDQGKNGIVGYFINCWMRELVGPTLLQGRPLVLSGVSSSADVHWRLYGHQLVKQARRTVTESSFPISRPAGGEMGWLVSSPTG